MPTVSSENQKRLTRPSWDEYFMMVAKLVASRSTCHSRAVGAVIVKDRRILSSGYNGSPPGDWHCIDRGECYWRQPENHVEGIPPHDLSRAIHAEVNAVAHAARNGIKLDGSTVYTTLSPCMNCLKVLISTGVKKVFFEHIYDFNNKGGDKYLLEQYEKNRDLIDVRQLEISKEVLTEMGEFLKGVTSARRYQVYDF